MSPRLLAILIGLFVVLAAGGVMLIPGGGEEHGDGRTPGVLQPGDRAVPGRTGGGRGSGLMMNQGSRSVAAPMQPAPSAQVRDDGSGPGFQSGDRTRRASAPDRAVSDASGETRGPVERRQATTVRGPQSAPGRTAPARGNSAADRAAAERNADIARHQAIREAQQRAQMAQRNRASAQRAAGRQNATQQGAGNGQGQESGDGTRTTGGTGTGGGSGGATGPMTGGGGSGVAAGGGGRGGSSGGQSGGSGPTAGGPSGGSGGSGSGGGGGGGSTVGGVPNVTVNAEFRQVSINTGACPDLVGHRTVDLYLVFSQPVGVLTVDSSGADRIRVVGGALVQVPGGGNGPPNSGLVAGSPCLAFDSYFDLGGVPLSFATGPTFGGSANQTVTATWFTISPAQTTPRSGKHELRVARFTAPTTISDITGTLGVGYTIPGLQGSPSASVTLPSVASVFTGEPPAGGGPPAVEEPEEPEEPIILSGACCFPSAVCQGDLSAGDCSALGGVYQGDGTNCSSVSCPTGPGSDPGGGDPPGGGGGTPDPGDDPDDPPGGGEPEEPEPQPGVTGVWLAVDNDGVECNPDAAGVPNLSGVNTFDLYLRMPAPHRLLLVESNPTTSHLMITGGAVFQHSLGSNVAPNPNVFVPFPCLEFDSYLVFEDVAEPIVAPQPSSPSIIGLNASGGAGSLSETTWTGAFGALWFLTPPPSILGEKNPALFGDELYYVRIGRFSLPEGVSVGGKLNASLTLAGSGQSSLVTAIPVPTVSGP